MLFVKLTPSLQTKPKWINTDLIVSFAPNGAAHPPGKSSIIWYVGGGYDYFDMKPEEILKAIEDARNNGGV